MGLLERCRLDGRVALVTGAAGGLGTAIVAQIQALGARVVLSDFSDHVHAAAESHGGTAAGVVAVKTDVIDPHSVQEAVDTALRVFGRLDIAVANAGIAYEEPTETHSDENWRRVMAVNLDGVFHTVRAAGVPMLRAGGGAIVATASIAGAGAVRPEIHLGYDVSKAGVAHLCRNLAIEWAPRNIRVNAVGPGYCDTEMLAKVGREKPEVMRVWLDDMPIHRLIAPREVADAVAFLVSDAASGITGQVLMVDGGYSAA